MSDFSDRPKHYLREWRGERSLEAVAETIKILGGEPRFQRPDVRPVTMTHATLSRIERNLIPYNQILLEILAEIYRTDVASLLIRDPRDSEGIWSIWDQVPPSERQKAINILQQLIPRTGTGG